VSVDVIAEVGSVHDGSFGNAVKLVELAARCGANTVKFQTHIARAETIRNAPQPPYFDAEPRYEYFERTAFSLSQLEELIATAAAAGVEFLSSPFSLEAVDLLEHVGVRRYKVPSGEVTNLPLLERIAETGKGVLLSSGMSSWEELDEAVSVLRRRHGDVTVLQCTTEYPCPYDGVGLNVLTEMQERYGLPVGLSDHTLTPWAGQAAVVLGATVVEKHLTFSRSMYGSDAAHSMEPAELTGMIQGIRAIEAMLESPVDKSDATRFSGMKAIFEKSVFTAQPITAGTVLGREMLAFKKPGTGISARRYAELLGRRVRRDLPADHPIREDDLSPGVEGGQDS
jgi:N-acetylneuraminate synthase